VPEEPRPHADDVLIRAEGEASFVDWNPDAAPWQGRLEESLRYVSNAARLPSLNIRPGVVCEFAMESR
jgi:hypothetical protein